MFAAQKADMNVGAISGVGDMMLHPFHIHGTHGSVFCQKNGKAPAAQNGLERITVRVEGGISEVLVRIRSRRAEGTYYMAHCHLLRT